MGTHCVFATLYLRPLLQVKAHLPETQALFSGRDEGQSLLFQKGFEAVEGRRRGTKTHRTALRGAGLEQVETFLHVAPEVPAALAVVVVLTEKKGQFSSTQCKGRRMYVLVALAVVVVLGLVVVVIFLVAARESRVSEMKGRTEGKKPHCKTQRR
jgi:hypothetical protein